MLYLGVDAGSVSTNLVLIDEKHKVLSSLYLKTHGQPIEVTLQGLKKMKAEGFKDTDVRAVGVTGSARFIIGLLIGADLVKNEITAHATAGINAQEDVKTIFEIGGQDSKIIIIRDKVVVDFAMNMVCAAGTGSFLEQQAHRLKIPIEEFGQQALAARESVRIAGRCTVFAESDMVHKQQLGYPRENIIAGLCDALVRNYLYGVAKGKKIIPPILFQGGVAHNIGIRNAFEKELAIKLVVPEHFDVLGALGAAILAKDGIAFGTKTLFRGFDISDKHFIVRAKVCQDCANHCEIMEALMDTSPLAKWGDKCGKWQYQTG